MRDSYTVPVYFTPLDMGLGGYGFSGMQQGERYQKQPLLVLDKFKDDKFWKLLVETRDEAGLRRDRCA